MNEPLGISDETASALEARGSEWQLRALELVIEDQQDYDQAGGLLVRIKALGAEIDDAHDPHIKRAHEMHRALLAQKARYRAPLDEAERAIKRELARYYTEQERLRLEAVREAEAAARAAAEEAEAQAQALEVLGSEAEAEEVRMEAALAVAPPVEVPLPTAPGTSVREVWKAEVTNLRALVRAVADGDASLALLQVDTKVLGQLARSLQSELKLPGVRCWPEKQVAGRARA